MSKPPTELHAKCPECDGRGFAVVPTGSVIVNSEDEADGKVWVNCKSCDDQFLAYYRDDD